MFETVYKVDQFNTNSFLFKINNKIFSSLFKKGNNKNKTK